MLGTFIDDSESMSDYYAQKLSADRLKRCYDIAPQRVRQYLEAELQFVLDRIGPSDMVLELGCGYGRILPELARKARGVVGIDTSISSLRFARQFLADSADCLLIQMDAAQLAFHDHAFDVVLCIQNGISAFHVDQEHLIRESLRVARRGGKILYSSYADTFWDWRLEWFRRQSNAGLLGEIDVEKTGNGVIVCKDGFTATTVGPARFHALTADLNVDVIVTEVDESSLFCEMVPR